MFANRERHDEEEHEEYKKKYLMSPESGPVCFDQLPRGIEAKDFVEAHFGPHSKAKHFQFRKGTTTLAFIYKPKTPNDLGGVMVAVDSRATGGSYIASPTVQKILPLNDRMVATMAGGAADCQYWIAQVRKYCSLYELRERAEISVRAASQYFSNILYQYRGKGLSVGSMIAGIDKKGPCIIQVDSSGVRIALKYCSIGSGMLNAYGILDTLYREEMTDEEALDLGRRAIMHAIYRDKGSGGFVRAVHISRNGVTVHPEMDSDELLTKFAERKGIEACEPSV